MKGVLKETVILQLILSIAQYLENQQNSQKNISEEE
nr:MAG TPA: hypothetical protein [Bacteriophage sp.]